MYIYNIRYGTSEENEYTQFYFDKKLTQEELREYVHRATINALKYYAIEHKDEFLFCGIKGEEPNFQDLYPKVLEELEFLEKFVILQFCKLL